MNTSKRDILAKCRTILSQHGIAALNMRTVAKECNIALGSIYYYFSSKDELLIATIASVWDEIFALKDICTDSFCEYVDTCFNRIHQGMLKYPNFLTIHSLSISSKNQAKAKSQMYHYLDNIKHNMLYMLAYDKSVDTNTFDADFTPESFVNFIIMNIISLLVQGHGSCTTLNDIIKRVLYKN